LMKLSPRVTQLALYDIRGGPGNSSCQAEESEGIAGQR
jgi:hypothetical protein